MNVGDRYGTFDRFLYRVAFRAGKAQHVMADVEEMLYGDELDAITLDRPVFITALPRAGTTILLKLLWETGLFATHTYQDMPFVLCPLIWSRYSSQFAHDIEPTERAHQDGLTVSGKSPEAFEEMLWKQFWPEHYREDRIRPWEEGDHNPEFEAFFERHMRKVIRVRRDRTDGDGRYLSKNNLNISRLAAPPSPLKGGTFLVPFRDPVQQAASMHRQHAHFREIHEQDDFIREYMEAIGHHEFGNGLKPVNFGGWLEEEALDPNGLEYWVRYWAATYRYVLEHANESTVLVSYARLSEHPESALSDLAEAVGIPPQGLVSQATSLHAPRTHPVNENELPDALLRESREIYERLDEQASV